MSRCDLFNLRAHARTCAVEKAVARRLDRRSEAVSGARMREPAQTCAMVRHLSRVRGRARTRARAQRT